MSQADREHPKGYEPAEVSAAKDHVYVELESAIERAGYEADEIGLDLIKVADRIVSRLIAHEVVIPEELTSPFPRD